MLNRIELQGYLGRDPELTEKQGQHGPYKSVSFSIGVGRDFGDGTDWFYCVMNGKRAEVIEKYFSKGSEILVSGRMESYKPKNDPDRTAWLVKMDDFHFTRNGNSSGSSNKSGSTGSSAAAPQDENIPDGFEQLEEEDIPF